MGFDSASSPFSLFRASYPDPFLDQASLKLPKSQQKLFEMLYLFSTTHPQIKPIISKLAKYPVTEIMIKSSRENIELEEKWKETLVDNVDIYEHAVGVGLDYMGYGNSFVTLHRPFVRSYRCGVCKVENPAPQTKYYIRNKQFVGQCPACGKGTTFSGVDAPVSKIDDARVIRIPPMEMHITYNDLTGEKIFYRDPPIRLKKQLTDNTNTPDRALLDNTPWVYIESVIKNKKIKYGKDRILHLMEPSLASANQFWGLPIIMAGLKDAYQNQIFKKADETVANERAVPARFVFPQATSQDPLRMISLERWSDYMAQQIARFRQDKNAIMPVPFPVGVAEVGGDAQRLTTAPLRELLIREIVGSTGVPEGFLSDGMTFSGGTVQLRMLENMLGGYIRALHRFANFVAKEVAIIMGWPQIKVEWKQFRKADDVQMLGMLLQMATQDKLSWKSLLERVDYSYDDEHDQIRREKENDAEIMSLTAIAQAKSVLDSVSYQVETNDRSAAIQELKGKSNSTRQSAYEHLTRSSTFDQDQQQQAQQQEQQADMERRQQEAEIDNTEAMAQKRMGEAQKAQLSVGMTTGQMPPGNAIEQGNQDSQQPQMQPQEQEQDSPYSNDQTVSLVVQKVIAMSPQDRAKYMQNLQANAPQLAQVVQQKLTYGDSQDAVAKQPDLLDELMQVSKSPDELANKIMMLPTSQKGTTLNQLLKQDPGMGIVVAKKMRELMGGGLSQSKTRVSVPDKSNEVKP